MTDRIFHLSEHNLFVLENQEGFMFRHFRSSQVMWVFTAVSLILLALFATVPQQASADNQLVRLNEVMAGLNGDSKVQYVVLEVASNDQLDWGPQPGDPSGFARSHHACLLQCPRQPNRPLCIPH